MRGTDGITWTDERVARLKALWEAGMSSAQIAADLGCFRHCGDGGRSAVIGKIHRLGLPLPTGKKTRLRQTYQGRQTAPQPAAPAPSKPQKIASISRSLGATFSGDLCADNAVRRVELPEAFEAAPAAGVQLLKLTDSSCRWPIGDPGAPGFAFCGGNAIANMPYCARHCRIAYEPGRTRALADRRDSRALNRADIQS